MTLGQAPAEDLGRVTGSSEYRRLSRVRQRAISRYWRGIVRAIKWLRRFGAALCHAHDSASLDRPLWPPRRPRRADNGGAGVNVRKRLPSHNALRNAGCKTVDDVRRLGPDRLRRQKNCGKVSMQEISDAIGGWLPPTPPPLTPLPSTAQSIDLKRLSPQELLDHLSALAYVQAALLAELAVRMPELRRVSGAIHRVRSRP